MLKPRTLLCLVNHSQRAAKCVNNGRSFLFHLEQTLKLKISGTWSATIPKTWIKSSFCDTKLWTLLGCINIWPLTIFLSIRIYLFFKELDWYFSGTKTPKKETKCPIETVCHNFSFKWNNIFTRLQLRPKVCLHFWLFNEKGRCKL